MKVAIIGTVGVPANYGGFETLVENLLTHKHSSEIEYTVFCSSRSYETKMEEYKGAKLVYINYRANGYQAMIYDTISLLKALKCSDVIVALGCDAIFFWPIIKLFTNKKLIVHFDGLDFARDKFNFLMKGISRLMKTFYVKYATNLISDNQGIVDYVSETFHRESDLIEYGGDNAIKIIDDKKLCEKYGLSPHNYSFKVARIEPENNIQMVLNAYSQIPEKILVVVGNWNRSEFGKKLRNDYSQFKNIKMWDPIYETEEINLLRSNCELYIHGHSVGGTNPSLVEAMSLGLPILAFDVIFNRETTENKAKYFKSADDLIGIVDNIKLEEQREIGNNMREIARRRYTWDIITKKYEDLFIKFYEKNKE